jgi:hypothetical protein
MAEMDSITILTEIIKKNPNIADDLMNAMFEILETRTR